MPFVLGGGFNCRVGLLNQLNPDILNQFSIFNYERLSNDVISTFKGRCFVDLMESHNCVLLNRRSPNDSPANFTFVGAQGFSIVDLVWCSLDCLSLFDDLRVLQVPTLSDHLPVAIYFRIFQSKALLSEDNFGKLFF